jgi:hypothetical protein
MGMAFAADAVVARYEAACGLRIRSAAGLYPALLSVANTSRACTFEGREQAADAGQLAFSAPSRRRSTRAKWRLFSDASARVSAVLLDAYREFGILSSKCSGSRARLRAVKPF